MDRWTRKVRRNKAPQVREEGREFTNNGAVDYFPVPKIAMIPFKKPKDPLYVHSAIGHLRCLKRRKSGLHRTRGNRIKKRRQISRQAPVVVVEPRQTSRQPPDESDDDMDTALDYVASDSCASDSCASSSSFGLRRLFYDQEEQEACDKVEEMIKDGVDFPADYQRCALPTALLYYLEVAHDYNYHIPLTDVPRNSKCGKVLKSDARKWYNDEMKAKNIVDADAGLKKYQCGAYNQAIVECQRRGIDPTVIPRTGRDNMLTYEDVLKFSGVSVTGSTPDD